MKFIERFDCHLYVKAIPNCVHSNVHDNHLKKQYGEEIKVVSSLKLNFFVATELSWWANSRPACIGMPLLNLIHTTTLRTQCSNWMFGAITTLWQWNWYCFTIQPLVLLMREHFIVISVHSKKLFTYFALYTILDTFTMNYKPYTYSSTTIVQLFSIIFISTLQRSPWPSETDKIHIVHCTQTTEYTKWKLVIRYEKRKEKNFWKHIHLRRPYKCYDRPFVFLLFAGWYTFLILNRCSIFGSLLRALFEVFVRIKVGNAHEEWLNKNGNRLNPNAEAILRAYCTRPKSNFDLKN